MPLEPPIPDGPPDMGDDVGALVGAAVGAVGGDGAPDVGARVQGASSGNPATVSAPNDCPMYSCFEHDVWMLTVCDKFVDVVWH